MRPMLDVRTELTDEELKVRVSNSTCSPYKHRLSEGHSHVLFEQAKHYSIRIRTQEIRKKAS